MSRSVLASNLYSPQGYFPDQRQIHEKISKGELPTPQEEISMLKFLKHIVTTCSQYNFTPLTNDDTIQSYIYALSGKSIMDLFDFCCVKGAITYDRYGTTGQIFRSIWSAPDKGIQYNATMFKNTINASFGHWYNSTLCAIMCRKYIPKREDVDDATLLKISQCSGGDYLVSQMITNDKTFDVQYFIDNNKFLSIAIEMLEPRPYSEERIKYLLQQGANYHMLKKGLSINDNNIMDMIELFITHSKKNNQSIISDYALIIKPLPLECHQKLVTWIIKGCNDVKLLRVMKTKCKYTFTQRDLDDSLHHYVKGGTTTMFILQNTSRDTVKVRKRHLELVMTYEKPKRIYSALISNLDESCNNPNHNKKQKESANDNDDDNESDNNDNSEEKSDTSLSSRTDDE